MAHKTLGGRICQVTVSAARCLFHKNKRTRRTKRTRSRGTGSSKYRRNRRY